MKDKLSHLLACMVGEAEADSPPVLTTSEVLDRAEADGQIEVIVGFAKDPKKSLAWKLKKLRGRHLVDSQGRAFEFGRGELSAGSKYPVRFLAEQPEAERGQGMKEDDFFPGVQGGGPEYSGIPLERYVVEEIRASGGGDADLAALLRTLPGPERDRLHQFLLDYYRQGETVISAFEEVADGVVRQGFPASLGCETLSAGSRLRFRGFALSNNVRPGYVIALRIKRPDLAAILDAEASWPLALLWVGWSPWKSADA